MRIFVYLAIASVLLSSCMNSSPPFANRTIEYAVAGDTYVVIAALDGISREEAKSLAMQRAAEMTAAQGKRYFTIDSETDVEVMKSEDAPDSQRFYGNMYQELIIERDFDRERQARRPLPAIKTYPGFRLEFTMYKVRPNRKAIDACGLTKCQ